jgi:hypothetical protein
MATGVSTSVLDADTLYTRYALRDSLDNESAYTAAEKTVFSQVAPVSDGFLGTRAVNVDTRYSDFPVQMYTQFTATGGEVSYVYIRFDPAYQQVSYYSPGIWDTSGNIVAYSADCDTIAPATGLARYTLNSPVTLSDGVDYRLGYKSAKSLGYYSRILADVNGINREELSVSGTCSPVDTLGTTTQVSTRSLPIWASNDPDEDGS